MLITGVVIVSCFATVAIVIDTQDGRTGVINRKAKGTRNEHRTMALLEAAGYACTRSGASLGVFDIIGVSATDVVFVQVKSRDWPGAVEMEAIKNFRCPSCCKKIIHRYRDGVRNPDVRTI